MARDRRGREHPGVSRRKAAPDAIPSGIRFARRKCASLAGAVDSLKEAPVASRPVVQAVPLYAKGMRIGLLGGSFNPPHAAHRAISLFAIKRLNLDRVWWLVTPGNPLKE